MKLSERQEKLLTEKLIRPMVKRIMTEKKILKEESEQLDTQEVKSALTLINHLAAAGTIRHSVNDRGLLDLDKKISSLRIEIMRYVEENSNFTFYGKSPSGFKLVKKK